MNEDIFKENKENKEKFPSLSSDGDNLKDIYSKTSS